MNRNGINGMSNEMDYINVPYSPQNNINNTQRNLKQKIILFIKGTRHIKNKEVYKTKIYRLITNI
jgi:hypothetical protein